MHKSCVVFLKQLVLINDVDKKKSYVQRNSGANGKSVDKETYF